MGKADKDRQHFIVLPTADMDDVTNLNATPADTAALTRAILYVAGLTEDESEVRDPAMIALASRFWTEHSARASLVSMARAIQVPKTVTDRIGWWSVGGEASEGYIRTYRTLIAKVQEKVATTIRQAAAGKNIEDTFGENYVL